MPALLRKTVPVAEKNLGAAEPLDTTFQLILDDVRAVIGERNALRSRLEAIDRAGGGWKALCFSQSKELAAKDALIKHLEGLLNA